MHIVTSWMLMLVSSVLTFAGTDPLIVELVHVIAEQHTL